MIAGFERVTSFRTIPENRRFILFVRSMKRLVKITGVSLVEFIAGVAITGVTIIAVWVLLGSSIEGMKQIKKTKEAQDANQSLMRLVRNRYSMEVSRNLKELDGETLVNGATLAQFGPGGIPIEGYVTLAQAIGRGSNVGGKILIEKTGSKFHEDGTSCKANCPLSIRAKFVPIYPNCRRPPCATDLADLEFTITYLKEPTLRTVKWSTKVTPSDFNMGGLGEICGGARRLGKLHGEIHDRDVAEEKSTCSSPATEDNSCNRWGCAITDKSGTSSCPKYTREVRVSENPVYFACRVKR